MRGKIARQLRRATEFDPHADRTYQELKISTKMARILQFNPETKEVKEVLRPVDAFLTECTFPPRKLYKLAKRQYNGFNDEVEFNRLPSKETLHGISKEILRTEEGLSTAAGGNVPNENRQDGGVNYEEG